MRYFWIVLVILQSLLFHFTDLTYEIPKYCREKERLIDLEEFDEYLLVEAVVNSSVLLECHFCNVDESNPEPKTWFWQDRYQSEPEKEVELGMDSNVSLNRIYMVPDLSLVIRELRFSDAGVYRCHGIDGQEIENKFNYKIEPVFENPTSVNVQKGNLTDWEKYREVNILPVTLRFSVSKMKELYHLRKNGIILEVLSEWGPWGPCENCVGSYGTRTSETVCRIKRKINQVDNTNTSVVNFFQKSPIIPCRSFALAEKFPSVSRAVRDLPSFILEEKCKNCKRVKKIKKFAFKYKKRYVLREGSHLIISCPESDTESKVVWRKNGLVMKKGAIAWTKKKKKEDQKSKTIVDVFSTLYLIEVSQNEEGNYTCYVNGQNMMTLKVVVATKSKLLTKAFFRHSKYLGFILLLTLCCYCAGLIQSFRQRHDLNGASYTKVENQDPDEDHG